MIDLAFADESMIGKGRHFNCESCPTSIQKKRRCKEDKWDFKPKDDIIFPIEVYKGGPRYGFCPGKVTWVSEFHTKRIFDLLVLTCETKFLLYEGGIMDQPSWYISKLSWFMPKYNALKEAMNQKRMWGSSGSNNRHTAAHAFSRASSFRVTTISQAETTDSNAFMMHHKICRSIERNGPFRCIYCPVQSYLD